jgi:hypothetical protein
MEIWFFQFPAGIPYRPGCGGAFGKRGRCPDRAGKRAKAFMFRESPAIPARHRHWFCVSITIVEIAGSEFICRDILFIARMLIFGAN